MTQAQAVGERLASRRKGVQASQSVLPSPDQVLQATNKEHWIPGLLGVRTMRKDSLAFSRGRSGSLAAGSYFDASV